MLTDRNGKVKPENRRIIYSDTPPSPKSRGCRSFVNYFQEICFCALGRAPSRSSVVASRAKRRNTAGVFNKNLLKLFLLLARD